MSVNGSIQYEAAELSDAERIADGLRRAKNGGLTTEAYKRFITDALTLTGKWEPVTDLLLAAAVAETKRRRKHLASLLAEAAA
jgi:hypothetical protein